MKVYLLRHGETEFNTTKQYTGTLDIPVSPLGLKKLQRADFDIDFVYVSSLRRTSQTAQVLFPTAKLVRFDDLREMCFGELEGQHYELSSLNSEKNNFARTAKGGETREHYISRTCKAFKAIINNAFLNKIDTIVIVAHGGTQMAVLSHFAYPKKKYEEWCGKNGGGFVLDVNADDWEKGRVSVVNEVCYSN